MFLVFTTTILDNLRFFVENKKTLELVPEKVDQELLILLGVTYLVRFSILEFTKQTAQNCRLLSSN